MDTAEFKEVFAAEARDYLQSLNENLLALENDPQNRGVLDDMFRAAHSLKGMSGTMGFEELATFTHQMESVLDVLRIGELTATTRVINVLFKSVDTLEVLLDQTLEGGSIDDARDVISLLKQVFETGDEQASSQEDSADVSLEQSAHTRIKLDEFDKETLKQGIGQGYNAFEVLVTLRKNTLLKSVRVYTVFQALEGIGTIIKCNPSAQDLEEERFDNEFAVLVLTQEESTHVQKLVEGISEIEGAAIVVPDADKAPANQIPTPGPDLVAQDSENEDQPRAAKTTKKSTQGTSPTHRGRFADKFVRVETDRLDKLINLVGELVISRTQVLEMGKGIAGSDAKNTIVQLDRITTDLQYAAMKLRMVPIKQVFDRFPRMVRDLAQNSNKDIKLELFGEGTELDRSIVNQIGDPLVHLIRNSVDHGIESREERRAAGKPEQGTIRLGARHEGSHVLIEISDDGHGINVDRIKAKAIERGILAKNFDGKLSVQEAIGLLFEPGFSTADSVTDISGRGVGMDAVKAVVEALSGVVEIDSIPGKSTRTTIKLPLTLAIIKALLVSADGETYAIPIQAVRENIQIERSQIKTLQQHNVIVIRDEVLPLFDLAGCLGFTPNTSPGSLPVIVVEARDEKVGFIVEDLIGQQEIVIKSLSDIFGDIPGIAGATVLGNGNLALILDNSTLIRQGA